MPFIVHEREGIYTRVWRGRGGLGDRGAKCLGKCEADTRGGADLLL